MSLLAAVHVSPAWSIPPAALLCGLLAWYWWRLNRAKGPESRKRIRRVSVIVLFAALPPLVMGLSGVDAAQDPRRYVLVWSLALMMMMTVLVLAVIDVINSLRLHANAQEQEAVQAAGELLDALRRREAAASQETQEGTGS